MDVDEFERQLYDKRHAVEQMTAYPRGVIIDRALLITGTKA
jgi:hypothetical protein